MTLVEHLTPDILVAEVLMSRASFPGSFLVLEGPDDRRFWERRIDKAACKCSLAHAKTTLLLAFQKLDRSGFRGALGVVDADLDHLEGRPPTSPNIVATDTVDLEALLLRSPALESVLLEFGEASKIATFERAAGHDVRTALLQRTLPFGHIRWASERKNLGISMDHLSPYKYVGEKTWDLDEERLFRDAADHAGASSVDGAELHRTSVGLGITAWERHNPPFVVLSRSAA